MCPYLLVGMLLASRYYSEEDSKILGRPELFGPSVAVVNDVVDFNCELLIHPKNETILLELFKEGNRHKLLGFNTAHVTSFSIFISTFHEGNLECVARAQNNSQLKPAVSHTHNLKVIEPVAGAEVIIQSGSSELFEGSTLELRCTLTAGNHVSYKWLVNGRPVSQSQLHDVTNDQLFIYRITSADTGSYMCIATNHYNTTRVFTSNSSDVEITVKETVSKPDISFNVSKEDFHKYFAVVTCQSTRGTLPIAFSLHNRTELAFSMTVNERKAIFKVPLVLDKHLGWLRCQANNGNEDAFSQWLPLLVERVSGPVKVHYDYDIGKNYAVNGLRFYCKATKGSHPRYRWFLNQTLLRGRGSFYYTVDQPPDQSILLLSVGRSSAGTYHCEVSDIFDNATAISSNKQYIDKKALNRLPGSVVAFVFGCFTFLLLLVSACCLDGVFRTRKNGENATLSQEMETFDALEDELEISEYHEDDDVVKSARCDGLNWVGSMNPLKLHGLVHQLLICPPIEITKILKYVPHKQSCMFSYF
ncbi:platelet endothelial cell adhesion molecule isoform X2 [Syngnathoides biaculeatus]|uniref:platelet endothelial cell adhesion molecule isoform X2 n=1 Tax=Syngnathoides biaculeatus TaxID=300417 RepID=UPI002ADDE26B|nr:platelet endothelial cell adhesion molecule isoform X2 [Syngnathoides biaculeatus]